MKKIKRPTIGFLTANLNLGASRVLWPGILDAAEKGDVNLITFPGGRLYSSEDYENQSNAIFDLISTANLDGLVSWASALSGAGTATPEEIVQFHQRYCSLPTVSSASSIGYGPMVSIDGYQGMKSLVSHLIDVHGYRRISLEDDLDVLFSVGVPMSLLGNPIRFTFPPAQNSLFWQKVP
jgi:DNA-binding LacI/PurR family transcriptional regulator